MGVRGRLGSWIRRRLRGSVVDLDIRGSMRTDAETHPGVLVVEDCVELLEKLLADDKLSPVSDLLEVPVAFVRRGRVVSGGI